MSKNVKNVKNMMKQLQTLIEQLDAVIPELEPKQKIAAIIEKASVVRQQIAMEEGKQVVEIAELKAENVRLREQLGQLQQVKTARPLSGIERVIADYDALSNASETRRSNESK